MALAATYEEATDVAQICSELKALQYYRRYYTKLIVRQTNAAAGIIRHEMYMAGLLEAGDKETGIKDPKSIAAKVVAAVMNDKEPPKECPESIIRANADAIKGVMYGINPPDRILEDGTVEEVFGVVKMLDKQESEMKELAKQLPVHQWQKNVKGFGELGLASIVGTVGDLTHYPNPDKLKKRLGLDVFNGRAYSTWRMQGFDSDLTPEQKAVLTKEVKAEFWTNAKYDPHALATVVADLSDSLIKHQLLGVNNKLNATGEAQPRQLFGALYLDEKKHQTAKFGGTLTKLHIANRARRYMLQQVIIALWCVWHDRPYRFGYDVNRTEI